MGSHFWKNKDGCEVAFVLSAPGQHEEKAARPAAGITGINLDQVLVELNIYDPSVFPSVDRYYYLITNASSKILYKGKDGRTEDTAVEITRASNITRILHEIGDCPIVILCGAKAELLRPHIGKKIIISSCHPGNQGLRRTYLNSHPEIKGLARGAERDQKRKQLCASNIYEKLAGQLK